MIIQIDVDSNAIDLHNTVYELATIFLSNGLRSNKKVNDLIVDIGLACGLTIDDFSKITSLAFHRKQAEKDSDNYAQINGYDNMNQLLSSIDNGMPDFNATCLQ